MSHIHSTCTTLFKTFILKVIQAKNIAIRYDASRYILSLSYNLGRHKIEDKYKVAAKNVV